MATRTARQPRTMYQVTDVDHAPYTSEVDIDQPGSSTLYKEAEIYSKVKVNVKVQISIVDNAVNSPSNTRLSINLTNQTVITIDTISQK
jgi:hypothetical protein